MELMNYIITFVNSIQKSKIYSESKEPFVYYDKILNSSIETRVFFQVAKEYGYNETKSMSLDDMFMAYAHMTHYDRHKDKNK